MKMPQQSKGRKKKKTLLANCQRNRLAIACRHKSACYIAEVFTFIALLLISCDSLALSYQTTCFYIDKSSSQTASKLRLHAQTPCKLPPELFVSYLVIGTIQLLEFPNELKKKSFSLIYLCMFSYCSFIMYSFPCFALNILFPLLQFPFNADCFQFQKL